MPPAREFVSEGVYRIHGFDVVKHKGRQNVSAPAEAKWAIMENGKVLHRERSLQACRIWIVTVLEQRIGTVKRRGMRTLPSVSTVTESSDNDDGKMEAMSIQQAIIKTLARDDARSMLDLAITDPVEFLAWAEALLLANYKDLDGVTALAMLRMQRPDVTIPELLGHG